MSILRTDKIAGLDSVSAITGSVKFTSDAGAGQGTYLEVNDPDGTIKFGTGEFSIEFWMYANTTDTSTQENDLASILDYGYGSSNNTQGAWFALHQEDRTLHFGFNNANQVQSSNFLNANTWHHIAIQRQGGNTKIYGDGTQVATVADTHDYTDALFRTLQIGSQAASGVERNFDGYISTLRICKGHAVYNGAFTPPTRALEVHPGPDDDRTVVFCCYSSQDATQEATGKTLAPMPNSAGPLASTFVPDVGNDHTHGTVLEGGTAFSSLNYMTLPRGTTAQRANSRGRAVIPGGYNPSLSPVASRSLNTIEYLEINTTGNALDFGDLSFGSASGGSCGSSTRGLIGGSYISPSITGSLNNIDYITIATTGNGADFGDLTQGRSYLASFSSSTRGIWAGGAGNIGSPYMSNVIDYVTIATAGNATDFGDSADVAYYGPQGASSPTRGIWAGGSPSEDMIQYVTIASTGNANEFGNLSANRKAPGEASSNTRCIIVGGYTPTVLNTMEYITIATTGNAKDFGDLTFGGGYVAGTSNCIRAVWSGRYTVPATHNTIQYSTIQTLGNAQDFGDLNTLGGNLSGAISDTHGGLA